MEILVLEASTTSAKAMLYNTADGSNTVKSCEYRQFAGGSESNLWADYVFGELMSVGREVAQGHKVEMISLSGTWHSVMLCDKDMVPQTPLYLWNYTGAAEMCREMRLDAAATKEYYNRTGCMVNGIYPLFKVELLRRKGLKVDDCYIVSHGGYNNYRLTGKFISTRCLTSGSGLLNIHTRNYDTQSLEYFHIREDQLAQLTESTEAFPLTQEAANLLGVQAGIPVLPSNSDGGLNQVGVGALKKGVATFSVGTSGAIRLTADKPVLPENPSIWCYLSPKAWLSGAATNGCTNCIDWARRKLFPEGTSYAEIESGVSDYVTTPVFLPFLFGERCPGWNDDRRGGFCNVTVQHNANDLYRAVQEGVLFNLYHCYQILSEVNGKPTELKLSGGILNSPTWKQMCANIFNCTLTVDDTAQGSLLGGAVLAMEVAGILNDVRDYAPKVVGTIEPNPEKVGLYREKYQRYLNCYNALV